MEEEGEIPDSTEMYHKIQNLKSNKCSLLCGHSKELKIQPASRGPAKQHTEVNIAAKAGAWHWEATGCHHLRLSPISEHQFKLWLLCFEPISLPTHLAHQQKMAQIRGPCRTWGTRMKFQAPGSNLLHHWDFQIDKNKDKTFQKLVYATLSLQAICQFSS